MNAGESSTKRHDTYNDDLTVLDAQIILAHMLGHPRTWLLAHLDTCLLPHRKWEYSRGRSTNTKQAHPARHPR